MIENDWAPEERREYERYSVMFYLRVLEQDTGAMLGHVVDISLGGFQLVSEDPIPLEMTLKVWLDVSLESGRKEKVSLKAACVWCREDGGPNQYHSGLRFVDPSQEARASIQALIDEIVASL